MIGTEKHTLHGYGQAMLEKSRATAEEWCDSGSELESFAAGMGGGVHVPPRPTSTSPRCEQNSNNTFISIVWTRGHVQKRSNVYSCGSNILSRRNTNIVRRDFQTRPVYNRLRDFCPTNPPYHNQNDTMASVLLCLYNPPLAEAC